MTALARLRALVGCWPARLYCSRSSSSRRVLLFSEPTTQEGTQVTSADSVVLERPAVDGWEPLTPTAGELRSGFSRADGVVGWSSLCRVRSGRLWPRRFPAKSRSVRATRAPRKWRTTRSGRWSQLPADSTRGTSSRLRTPSTRSRCVWPPARPVDGDRLLLAGSTGALRLENGRDLASIEWSTQSSTYRCVPDRTVWRTSVSCGDQRRDG